MVFTLPLKGFGTGQIPQFSISMRYSHAPCSLLLCFSLGGILAGCKSVATTFHRVQNELTSELIKEDADEETHYYGAWFIWSPPLNPKRQGQHLEETINQ
jgi:hypothetical protein